MECPDCEGEGQVVFTCDHCEGKGETEGTCPTCNGTTVIDEIPAMNEEVEPFPTQLRLLEDN